MSTTTKPEQATFGPDRGNNESGPRDRYVVVRSLADGGTIVSVGSVDPTRYVDLDELVLAIAGATAGESETDTAIDYLLNAETWRFPESAFGPTGEMPQVRR